METADLWRRRRWVILGGAGVLAAAAVVGLALFHPGSCGWTTGSTSRRLRAPPPSAPRRRTTGRPPTTARDHPLPRPPATASAPASARHRCRQRRQRLLAPADDLSHRRRPARRRRVHPGPRYDGRGVVLQDAAGTQFVRLENLDTSNGPDLYVYLSTNPPDGPEGQFDDDYVNLGRLEGNLGSSNY